MAKKLTERQIVARYEALTEAAMHLELMDWTDPSEQKEGAVMADWLKREALKWLKESDGAKMKWWHINGIFKEFKWLWWAAAGGSVVVLFLMLSQYLIQLANPWPILGLVFFGLATRAYANLAGDVHEKAGKTFFLLALTSILAIVLAMCARPLFVEMMHEVASTFDTPTPEPGLEWLREYIEPFKTKVIGYIGFYAAGYFFAYKLVARLGKSIPLLAYPRTKAELHAAFWEAAGEIPGVPLDVIDRHAERLLNEHKGHYSGRRPQS